MQSQFALGGGNQTLDQKTAYLQFDQLLSVLNTSTGGRYLFAGRSVDRAGGGDRRPHHRTATARAPASSRSSTSAGRPISAPAGSAGWSCRRRPPPSVGLAEDAVSPFGFKLAGVDRRIDRLDRRPGRPAAPAVAQRRSRRRPIRTPARPSASPSRCRTAPASDLTLTATASATPGPNEFTHRRALRRVTAANLQTALTQSLGTLADTTLSAASAVAAGNDFFNIDDANPPQRVDGPPFDTATALVDGTAANTVSWYLGEAGTDDARARPRWRASTSR